MLIDHGKLYEIPKTKYRLNLLTFDNTAKQTVQAWKGRLKKGSLKQLFKSIAERCEFERCQGHDRPQASRNNGSIRTHYRISQGKAIRQTIGILHTGVMVSDRTLEFLSSAPTIN
jgi:hypothetical protein